MLDRIAERVTGQDVALLNSGSVLRRDRDQHIDKAAQPTSAAPVNAMVNSPSSRARYDSLNKVRRVPRGANGDRHVAWSSESLELACEDLSYP